MLRRILFAVILLVVSTQKCLRQNFMGVCQECPIGGQLFEDNSCRRSMPVDGCWVHTIANQIVQCAICRVGYHLIEGGQCKANMPFCVEQTGNRCQQCNHGETLKNGVCLNRWLDPSSRPPHCLQALNNQSSCWKCEPGYRLYEGRCMAYPVCDKAAIFRGCVMHSQGKCTVCESNYQLTDRGRCLPVRLDNCAKTRDGNCQECNLLYQLAGGRCVGWSSAIPYCARQATGGGICLECLLRYQLVNGACIPTTKKLARIGTLLYIQYQQYSQTNEITFDKCLEIKQGFCVRCIAAYQLDRKLRCVRNLTELSRLRQTAAYSTSDEPSRLTKNMGFWRPSSNRTSWLTMRSTEVFRYWGVELRPNPLLTMRLISIIVSYEVEPNKLVCFRDCQPLSLREIDGTYQYTFRQDIITSAIRIVLVKWTGEASFQLDAFYSTVVFQDSRLRSVQEMADLFSTEALTTNPLVLRTTLSFDGTGYRFASNKSVQQYVGYRCKFGIMRVRRFTIQIGWEEQWLTEFILKYSMDGTTFYCVDRCNPYKLVGQHRSLFEFEIANPIFGRYLILVPKKWHIWPTLRVDFYYDQIVSQPNCKHYSSAGRCSKCEQNYTNVNGKCRVMVPGCQSVDETDGQCLQCLYQYYLRKSRTCELRKPGCIYLNDLCSSCIEGYSFKMGECQLKMDSIHRMSSISKVVSSSEAVGSKPLFIDGCSGKNGWLPKQYSTGEWIGLESMKIMELYYLEVIPGADGYLQSFYLKYSLDNSNYFNISFYGELQANSQGNREPVRIYFMQPLQAKGIRIYPLKWWHSINFNFEFYYHEEASSEWERGRKGLFSDVGDLMYSKRVAIFEMNPRINQNGSFTLPAEPGNWMGFSTDEDNNKRVTLTKVYIRGSELKNSWVERFYLMFSRKFGRKFQCYQGCTQLATNLTDTKTIVSLPLAGLDNITDIRLFPTVHRGLKSIRVDFEIA